MNYIQVGTPKAFGSYVLNICVDGKASSHKISAALAKRLIASGVTVEG